MAQYINQVGYGLSSALPLLSPYPITANRIPTANDLGYPLGQIWVAKNVPSVYILTLVAAGIATWQLVAPSGGGSFVTVTSTGQFTLDTTAVAANTLGNTNGATSVTISVGTGGFTVDGVASSVYAIGASTTTGTIDIGGAAQTGSITLGNSTGAQTVGVGLGGTGIKTVLLGTGTSANVITLGGTGANTITIGATQTAGSVAVGTAMTTGTITVGGTGLQTGTISIAPGTGAQSLLLGTGGTGIKTITIGGTAANVITIGNTQTAGSIAMGDAMTTGTITVGGTGLQTGTISIAPGTGAQSLLLGTGGTGAKTITIGGTAANVITIGNTQVAGSVSVGAAMTVGTISIGGTGLQTGTIDIAPGTGAQTVNIGTGAVGVKTINIGTGAIDNLVTIGTLTGVATTDILSGTGGIILNGGGVGDILLTPGAVSAAAYAATLDSRVGAVTLTGQVLASSGNQDLTITNSFVATTATPVMVTVDNLGANDAKLQVQRVTVGTGGFVVNVTNVGTQALNGDIHVNFIVLG